MILAFDPGLTGAIAVINPATGHLEQVIDLPSMEKTHGKGRQLDPYLLGTILSAFPQECVAGIERVAPMPGQGVTSMFGFGHTLGIIEGMCAARRYPTLFVLPQRWKKHFGLWKKEKDAARTTAIRLYPHMAEMLTRKKDINRADAILIATYLYQQEKTYGYQEKDPTEADHAQL
jgi:crossover junction endodeoxyribonuclease RuvC